MEGVNWKSEKPANFYGVKHEEIIGSTESKAWAESSRVELATTTLEFQTKRGNQSPWQVTWLESHQKRKTEALVQLGHQQSYQGIWWTQKQPYLVQENPLIGDEAAKGKNERILLGRNW